MEYHVMNENNCLVKVTDEQLEMAFVQKEIKLPVKIIVGMGAAKAGKYLPRLEEALYYEEKRSRLDAVYSLFSIEDSEIISILQRKEQSLPLEELSNHISEKAILQSLIIRLEGGPSSVQAAFFNDYVNPRVKYNFMLMYSAHFVMLLEDTHFLINALEAFSLKEEAWIKALTKDDYEDAVIRGLEAICNAMEKHNLLHHLSNDDYGKLSTTGKRFLEMRLDSIAKESIAIFSKGLPPSYAYSMLEPILKHKAKGDVQKELKKSLAILNEKEVK